MVILNYGCSFLISTKMYMMFQMYIHYFKVSIYIYLCFNKDEFILQSKQKLQGLALGRGREWRKDVLSEVPKQH